MLQPLLDSTTISLLEKVAVFGERRQQVLVGNVANIDTPGYKTRDLPVSAFRQALRDAVEARQSPASFSRLAGGTPAAEKTLDDFFPEVLFQSTAASEHNITFHDGNNRSIEHEMMELMKNSMMQSFAVELMNSQMKLMQSVIRERV